MKAPLSPRLPFEMFDCIRHINLLAVDLSLLQALIQQLSRWSNKRSPLPVFLIARLLTDDHDLDLRLLRLVLGFQFSENRLCRIAIEVATLAVLNCLSKYSQGPVFRHKPSGTFFGSLPHKCLDAHALFY